MPCILKGCSVFGEPQLDGWSYCTQRILPWNHQTLGKRQWGEFCASKNPTVLLDGAQPWGFNNMRVFLHANIPACLRPYIPLHIFMYTHITVLFLLKFNLGASTDIQGREKLFQGKQLNAKSCKSFSLYWYDSVLNCIFLSWCLLWEWRWGINS